MPIEIPTVVMILAIWGIVKGQWRIRLAIIVALSIYLYGTIEAFDLVRTSSTHGNTRHGWYSKDNLGEKFIALLWLISFPVLSAFGILFLYVPKPQKA